MNDLSPFRDPRLRRVEDQRRRILDAAIACFSRGGFHATGMQAICARAAMSPGALYRYFPSKEAIIEAIVERDRADLPELLAPLLEAEDVVGALVEAGRQFLAGNLQPDGLPIFAELCAEAIRNPAVRAIVARVDDEVEGIVARVIARGQALGQIDPELDPADAVQLLMSIADGVLLRIRIEPDAAVDRLLAMFDLSVRRFLAPRSGRSAA